MKSPANTTGHYPIMTSHPNPIAVSPGPLSMHHGSPLQLHVQLHRPQPVQWLAQCSSPKWLSPTPILFPPPPALPVPHFQQQWNFNPPVIPQWPRPALLPHFVYHYTDQASYENIMKSGRIFASGMRKPKGIVYGNGVYLTALPPCSKTSSLMTNNYGNPSYCGLKYMVAKSEYTLQFRSDDLRDLRPVGSGAGRNIFLYPWPWIELCALPFMTYRRSVYDGPEMNKVELLWKSPLAL